MFAIVFLFLYYLSWHDILICSLQFFIWYCPALLISPHCLLITCTQKEYCGEGEKCFPLGHQGVSHKLSVTNVSNHLD